jgi:hypothetical protein
MLLHRREFRVGHLGSDSSDNDARRHVFAQKNCEVTSGESPLSIERQLRGRHFDLLNLRFWIECCLMTEDFAFSAKLTITTVGYRLSNPYSSADVVGACLLLEVIRRRTFVMVFCATWIFLELTPTH